MTGTGAEGLFLWDEHGGFEMHPGKPLRPMLEPWHAAGFSVLSISIGFDAYTPETVMQTIAWARRRLAEDAPFARLAGTLAEIEAANRDGKMAVFFDIEGMRVLGDRVEMVEMLYDLGVRHMNFAYNLNTLAGSGCHDDDIGLTGFGRAVVAEMNRVGMVVDGTHSGYLTTMQAMEATTAPFIFSHSNPAALHPHGRNITDDQIRACAATGGVVGINGINRFLGVEVPTAADVARHVAYVAELTSVDHVGVTLDDAPEFDEADALDVLATIPNAARIWPADQGYTPGIACLSIREMPAIAQALRGIGFTPDEIARIMGGNFKRVASQVWRQ